MSNLFTLDSLREETKKKFDPFKIGLSDGSEVTLSSTLRLDSDSRKAVKKALEEINTLSDKEDTPETYDLLIEAMSKVLNAVADKPAKLLSDLDDDDQLVKASLMTSVLQAWAKETQLGEA